VVRVLVPTGDDVGWNPDPLYLVPLLSIRNKFEKSPYTEACIAAVEHMAAQKAANIAQRQARDAARAAATSPAHDA